MKKTNFLSMLFLLIAPISCTKNMPVKQEPGERTIQYVLFTNADLSNDNRIVRFSITMRSHTKILLDSALAPMKMKEIPHADGKIIINRIVPENNNEDLGAGFNYEIEGAGHASYVDSSRAGEKFKSLEFVFR